MEREPIESASLRSIGYDQAAQLLEVEFIRGGVYRYMDVPPAIYADLRAAASPGGLLARQIRNRYECWKLVRPRREE